MDSSPPKAPRVQEVTGTLDDGQGIEIGPVTVSNENGNLTVRRGDGTRFFCSRPATDRPIVVEPRPNMGALIVLRPTGKSAYAFVAELAAGLALTRTRSITLPRAARRAAPIVRIGQGDYRRDWPGPAAGGQKDQASGLRAAMAEGGAA